MISSTKAGTTEPWGRAPGSHTPPGPLAPGSAPERTVPGTVRGISLVAGGGPVWILGGDLTGGGGSLAPP